MTAKISRLYPDYETARRAARELEAAGVDNGDISIVANNADNRYKGDRVDTVDVRHDKDRNGVDDRSAVDTTARGTAYRKAGWTRFDETAPPYTADQVDSDRRLYS